MIWWFYAASSALLLSCSTEAPDSVDTDIPTDPGDDPVDDDTGDLFPEDTSTPDFDEVPANWLTISQTGSWSLSPLGGPYASLTGTLTAKETGDFEEQDTDAGEELVICEVEYALTGLVPTVQDDCPSCDFVFDVQFTVTSGSPLGCHDPDIPGDGVTRQLGYDATAGVIRYNHSHSGVWIPWYDANKVADLVTFDWQTTVAITVEDP